MGGVGLVRGWGQRVHLYKDTASTAVLKSCTLHSALCCGVPGAQRAGHTPEWTAPNHLSAFVDRGGKVQARAQAKVGKEGGGVFLSSDHFEFLILLFVHSSASAAATLGHCSSLALGT